jgi:hypothetical protein
MFDRGAFIHYDSYVANGVYVPSKMMVGDGRQRVCWHFRLRIAHSHSMHKLTSTGAGLKVLDTPLHDS